jgi:hypothetical protein
VAKATVAALKLVESPEMVAARRGVNVDDVVGNYDLRRRVPGEAKENA